MTAQSLPTPKLSVTLPSIFLRLENLFILIFALALYGQLEYSWGTFALWLLAPDVVFVFMAISEKLAAVAYNIVHSYVLPVGLAAYYLFDESTFGFQLAVIWVAHISMDRVVGYGFKYLDNIKQSHYDKI